VDSLFKQKIVTVPNEPSWGRDQGKTFLLTEMPAAQAEKWAMRAFLALKGSDSQIPTNIQSLGMVGVAIVTLNVFLRASVKFEELSPLLDEMLDCVKAVPVKNDVTSARPLIPGEIQEVATLGWLRSEVLELHTGFSWADAIAKFYSEISTTMASLST
jgi:hypothetical protein